MKSVHSVKNLINLTQKLRLLTIIIFLSMLNNYCKGQSNGPDFVDTSLKKSTDPKNSIILRYNFTLNTDSIIKPDYFDVFFTISEANYSTYKKRKYCSVHIGVDSVEKTLYNKLIKIKIDTTGIKLVAVGNANEYDYIYNKKVVKTFCLRVPSAMEVTLIKDSIHYPGLGTIYANGELYKPKDVLESAMLTQALEKADYLAKNYAQSNGLQVKLREEVTTTFYEHQKNRHGEFYSSNLEIFLSDIDYHLRLTVTYVLE